MSGRAHSSMLRPRSGTASSEAIDDRQRLFGRRASAPAPSVEVEAMEAANHAAVEGLAGQVGTMRHLALNIGDEVSGQNAYLDGMNGVFDNAGERLSASVRALQALSNGGGGGHMCILAAFAGVFFLLIYLLLK